VNRNLDAMNIDSLHRSLMQTLLMAIASRAAIKYSNIRTTSAQAVTKQNGTKTGCKKHKSGNTVIGSIVG